MARNSSAWHFDSDSRPTMPTTTASLESASSERSRPRTRARSSADSCSAGAAALYSVRARPGVTPPATALSQMKSLTPITRSALCNDATASAPSQGPTM